MAGNYGRFHVNRRSLPNGQGQTFDPNFLDSMVQQHIEQQQNLSPGAAESYGSTYSSSPARTPTTTTQQQQTSPQPYASQLHPGNYLGPNPISLPRSTTSPVSPQYGQPMSAPPDLNFELEMMDSTMPNNSGMFGHETNSASLGNYQIPAHRRSRGSIGQPAAHLQLSLPQFSAPQIQASINAPLLPPPSVSPQPRPRQSQSRLSGEDVIGQVLVSKKFKCSRMDCKDLTFGRLADLRRHFEQQHARNRPQYFCPYTGCSRSHAATGGKGRSFGTRKDKRDEHVRNVHEKDQHKAERDTSSQY